MRKCLDGSYLQRLIILLILFCVFSLPAEPINFTWQDGDRRQTIYLAPNYIAEIQKTSGTNAGKFSRLLPVTDAKVKFALSKAGLPKNFPNTHSEVFEEGIGGRKMTLPGGIFVEFVESWDDAKVKDWAVTEKLTLMGRLNSVRNIYRIDSSAGIESLHLANRLLLQAGIKSAFPNWWRESVVR